MYEEQIKNYADGVSIRLTQDIRECISFEKRGEMTVEKIAAYVETLHRTCELIIPKLNKGKRNEFYDWIHDYMMNKI